MTNSLVGRYAAAEVVRRLKTVARCRPRHDDVTALCAERTFAEDERPTPGRKVVPLTRVPLTRVPRRIEGWRDVAVTMPPPLAKGQLRGAPRAIGKIRTRPTATLDAGVHSRGEDD